MKLPDHPAIKNCKVCKKAYCLDCDYDEIREEWWEDSCRKCLERPKITGKPNVYFSRVYQTGIDNISLKELYALHTSEILQGPIWNIHGENFEKMVRDMDYIFDI